MHAGFGNIQLLDPASGSLCVVTQSGFSAEFLEYFAVVKDGHSACGRAAQACAQAVIADVTTDAGFAPHRQIAATSGFRAVQSTRWSITRAAWSAWWATHFPQPHRPPERDLQITSLFGDFAAEAVSRLLGIPAGGGAADTVGRAVLAALLDLGDG